VRQLLGCQRLDKPELIPLINDLYRTWGLYHNYFKPQTPFSMLDPIATHHC